MRNIIKFNDGGYLFLNKDNNFTICGRIAHDIYFKALRNKFDLTLYFKDK